MVKKAILGQKVPDFEVELASGEKFRMKDCRGSKTILYFYPKDNTPGCTTQGQEFNELLSKFKKMQVRVFGVSRDSVKSHQKFIEKFDFKFDLLSDSEEKMCRIFDVIKEKNMYGRKVMGIERSTFLIDEEGRLVSEWRKVKAAGHAKEILNWISSSQAKSSLG